ncbi:MAG: ECF transporter S component [Chloroflexota bacterium]|nr:ECF transporter S component [Chloroflexota bacterium]
MNLENRTSRRGIVWLSVLLLFVVLMVLANEMTDGERFYGVAPIVVIALAVVGLLQVYRATWDYQGWGLGTRQVRGLTVGTALYATVAVIFTGVLDLSVGPVALRPQVCIPILFGYAFGPVVGFFSGAVGSLLGDFIAGLGVFPAWHIGVGLMGLTPGLVAGYSGRGRDPSFVSNLVVVTIAIAASIVFLHPRVPGPWTGEVQNFSFWGWALVVGGLVMLANSLLLEDVSVILAAASLWGTLGILVGNGFAALAHVWINEYSLTTALIGEFAPSAATDILNLVVFTPIVLAGYRATRRRGRLRR